MANVEKLEQVLDYIKTHPGKHDQANWAVKGACGTTLCFAGTAVMLAGYEMYWAGRGILSWDCGSTSLCKVPEGHPLSVRMPKDLDAARPLVAGIPSVAQRELELTDDEREALFIDAANLDHLEAMVKNIANGDDVYNGVFEGNPDGER